MSEFKVVELFDIPEFASMEFEDILNYMLDNRYSAIAHNGNTVKIENIKSNLKGLRNEYLKAIYSYPLTVDEMGEGSADLEEDHNNLRRVYEILLSLNEDLIDLVAARTFDQTLSREEKDLLLKILAVCKSLNSNFKDKL